MLSMSEHDEVAVPRALLVAVGILLGLTLLIVSFTRITGIGKATIADAEPVTQRSLRYEDASDGSIKVRDARDGRLISVIEPGTNGFLRSTLRGLARERKRQGVGAEVPFELVGRMDGRLTLLDPATGRRIDLESFGRPTQKFSLGSFTPKRLPNKHSLFEHD
jgi:putative photosynthetic complex assembly protein